jgi:hypothetical protein
MLGESAASQKHRFRNGVWRYVACRILADDLPRNTTRHCVQHLCHENTGTPKNGLTGANMWIGDDVASQFPNLSRLVAHDPKFSEKPSADQAIFHS